MWFIYFTQLRSTNILPVQASAFTLEPVFKVIQCRKVQAQCALIDLDDAEFGISSNFVAKHGLCLDPSESSFINQQIGRLFALETALLKSITDKTIISSLETRKGKVTKVGGSSFNMNFVINSA